MTLKYDSYAANGWNFKVSGGFKSRHSDHNRKDRPSWAVFSVADLDRSGFEPGRALAVRAQPKRERERLQPGRGPGVNPAIRTQKSEKGRNLKDFGLLTLRKTADKLKPVLLSYNTVWLLQQPGKILRSRSADTGRSHQEYRLAMY